MKNPGEDQKLQWQPPPRPEWVRRINEEGGCMDIRGVVPLDERSLLDTAMRDTGLADFGADDWREPFQVLAKSMDEDAELHLIGRLRVRAELLRLLDARLQIEDLYKRHPEIDDEEIVQPLIVVGQGRSGTSFLNNVLDANPDNCGLRHWETMFPNPPPEKATYKTDPRIAKADIIVKQWYRITPTIESIYEFGGDVPQEDMIIVALNFMSTTWFGAHGQALSYDAYMAKQDIAPGLRYHRRVLKLLQWKNPRKHWVLKNPMHLAYMPALLKIYPDACLVWPHRDPVRAQASVVSLLGSFNWAGTDHPFKGDTLKYFIDPAYSAQWLSGIIDQLESGAVPPKQIYNLLYKDLVGDTMATMEAMYRHLGLTLSEEGRRGMAQYLADHPRDNRPTHKFSLGSEDSIACARQAYQRYQEYFGIPSE